MEPDTNLQATAIQKVITNGTDADSTESPTRLGYKLPNPYTVANMRQAYKNVYGGTWDNITANYKYVRFKPTSTDQLLTLTETLDLDLFDEPLDYQVGWEGDFYQDPAVPQEQITWQYTVVPASFTFPSGIPYEVLASLYLPADDYKGETEAERLVGLNADGDALAGGTVTVTTVKPDKNKNKEGVLKPTAVAPDCPPGYTYDATVGNCVQTGSCLPGTVWDPYSSHCVSATPPPIFTQTGGSLFVYDTQLKANQAVRNVRIVAKR